MLPKPHDATSYPSIILRIWKLEALLEEGDHKGVEKLRKEVLKDAKKAGFGKAIEKLKKMK